jgi:hypothetical protein
LDLKKANIYTLATRPQTKGVTELTVYNVSKETLSISPEFIIENDGVVKCNIPLYEGEPMRFTSPGIYNSQGDRIRTPRYPDFVTKVIMLGKKHDRNIWHYKAVPRAIIVYMPILDYDFGITLYRNGDETRNQDPIFVGLYRGIISKSSTEHDHPQTNPLVEMLLESDLLTSSCSPSSRIRQH